MLLHAPSKIAYNDTWFRIIGCLAASELIDSLGRTEPFYQRLATAHFYTDLLGGFVIAFLIWEFVRYTIRQLDSRYDWLYKPVQRISLQFLFGVLLPALLAFVGTLLFMRWAYDQDIFQTEWLYNEFYAVVLIIVLINLVYFTWWLYLHMHQQKAVEAVAPVVNTTIEVNKGDKTILLSHADIAFVILDGPYSFIKTFDEQSFVTSYTLDEMISQLGQSEFFRVNRQVIISRKACKAYQSIENGKIDVEVEPKSRSKIVVSQKRAKDFRQWIAKPGYTSAPL